jgi:hypothetical protein
MTLLEHILRGLAAEKRLEREAGQKRSAPSTQQDDEDEYQEEGEGGSGN